MSKIGALYILVLSLAILSCNLGGKTNLKPPITGSIGEIVVVLPRSLQEGDVRQLLDSVLGAEFEGLPQSERCFSLVLIPPDAFSSIFQTHRNLIFLKLSPQVDSITFGKQANLWASSQMVISLTAKDETDLLSHLKKKLPFISSEFELADKNRLIENTVKYQEIGLQNEVLSKFDSINISFPHGYQLRPTPQQNFFWASYETPQTSQSIIVYSYPWESSTTLPTLEEAIIERNKALSFNIPGTFAGSYMTTATTFPPSYKHIRRQETTFCEIRGLWEVEGDFMGGPFMSRLYYSPKSKHIIAVEGFVYAPNKPKRNYMRIVEAILYQTHF